VLCLLEDTRSGLCILLSGGVRRRLRLSAGASPPDSPRLPAYCPYGFTDLRWVSLVGGPDPRDAPCQFIPLTPFLAGAWLWGVLRTQFSGEIDVLSQNVQRCGGEFGREAEESESSYRVRYAACLKAGKTCRAREGKKRGAEKFMQSFLQTFS